ncbi:MAG: c-type cytochrome [Solirubrobacterales bacterium]
MRRRLLIAPLLALSMFVGACGNEGIELSKDDPDFKGAKLFADRCSGCHTLGTAGAEGSGENDKRVQGPNFSQRQVAANDALYAIRNGGFSGVIMPQNIVTGSDAKAVADFIGKYSGEKVDRPAQPGEADSPKAQ